MSSGSYRFLLQDDALEIVKELLAAAPNHINNQGMEGEYPLHIASACARSVMMVHYLISLQPESNLYYYYSGLPVVS